MFTHLLTKNDVLLSVRFTSYSEKHYLNKFKKNYPGRQWDYTEQSIKQDLARLRTTNNNIQESSQIDELKYKNNKWLAKYDFKVAGTNVSKKASGNRCVLYIDDEKDKVDILLIYNKNDLPKNKGETKFIIDEVTRNFSEIIKELYE